MKENEAAAHSLCGRLRGAGLAASVAGGGVHWQVEVAGAERSLLIHCFWYDRSLSGLFLGANPANPRRRPAPERTPRVGAEFLVSVQEKGDPVADGRTPHEAEVLRAAVAWVAGADQEKMASEAAFIDRKGRVMRAVARGLDPRLRCEIAGDPSYELWVYGEGRSCRFGENEGAISGAFFLGQAQVAFAAELGEACAAAARWLLDRPPVEGLAEGVAGVEIEPHAGWIERDPARWHWLLLRERVDDPEDVLAPLRPLIEALASSPVATRFYSYSSLNRLCFSASSHYPWVDGGLPMVAPGPGGGYLVRPGHLDSPGADGQGRLDFPSGPLQGGLDLAAAIWQIEEGLRSSPVTPFFGSAPFHELPLLAASLEKQGSPLHPRLVQSHEWFSLIVESDTGQCRVSDRGLTVQGKRYRSVQWPTWDEAARGIHRFLVGGVSLEALGADPRARAHLLPGQGSRRPSRWWRRAAGHGPLASSGEPPAGEVNRRSWRGRGRGGRGARAGRKSRRR